MDMADADAADETLVQSGDGSVAAGPEQETDGLESLEASEQASVDGDVLEDVELEGKTYQVPKALKGAFLRHADYTRKTQELAAERRSLEAERSVDAETLNLKSGVAAIEQRLAACEEIDWDALWREDPQTAQQLGAHLDELVEAHAQLSEELEGWSAQQAAAEAHEQAQKLQVGHAELLRDLPGWSPALGARLASFAMTEFGATQDEIADIYDPRIVKLLHAAYVGSNSRGLSREAQRHVDAQASRPAATVQGRASAGKTPSRMTTDEWMRHRNKQLRTRF